MSQKMITNPTEPTNRLQSKLSQGPLLIIGGLGCVLLLCVAIVTGSGLLAGTAFFAAGADEVALTGPDDHSLDQVETGEEAPSSNQTTDPAAGPAGDAVEALAETPARPEPAEDGAAAVEAAPQLPTLGDITFAADATAAGQPVEPDFAFTTGITKIHALFEYANFQPEQIWTQVLYHDGVEVSRTSQPWLAEEAGRYDYVVAAGGAPIPAGQWALEFYAGNELMTAGSFLIESDEAALSPVEIPDLADLPKVYRLAYPKWNGEKHDLYVGDTSGRQERYLLRGGAGPSWSPNGKYLFFYGEEGVDQQVINGVMYPLSGVTNGIARLTVSPLPANVSQLQVFQGRGWNDGTARWASVSPNGQMIAYDGDRGGGRRIYFLGTNSNQQFRYEIIGEQAAWSPDGAKIVYRSGRDNRTGIWISNRDDSGHTLLTNNGTDSFPTWSPDGSTIAFSRDVGGNVDIYAITIDGSNLRQLTTAPGHDTLPLYLPNGELIFRSARGGSWAIWHMKGDGSAQTLIIANAPVGPEWAFSKMSVLR